MKFARTVQAKLLLAFGLILALNIAVGVLAFRGFSQTETALDQLSDESLVDIVAAMTLAHDSSALAALAPFVSSVRVMNELENESARLSARIEEFSQFVVDLPKSTAFITDDRRGRVQQLAGLLSDGLAGLISTTKLSLDIRADIAERRYQLDIRPELPPNGAQASEFASAIELILTAFSEENEFTILALSDQYAARLSRFMPADVPAEPNVQVAFDYLTQQASTFDLVRRDIETQQRIRFLLATIHSLSTQLSEEVSSIVASTSSAVAERSARVEQTLGASKEIITLLGVLAAIAAALAAVYVMRDLAKNLADVTRAMTRLAGGDRSASVPGLSRKDELGGLARAFNVFKDASLEREMLAKQVSENAQMVEAMFSNMDEGICVYDAEGRLVAWNPQFVVINAMLPEDLEKPLSYADVVERFHASGGRAFSLNGQRLSPEEMEGNRKTEAARFELHYGDGRVVEVRSQPMPESGFVTSYSDQTERRSLDRQLREAQRMEAVGQLTGGIAHDFNNLLAAISGNLQMVHEELFDSQPVAGRVLRALDATERAAAVTQRLLAFASQQTLQPRMTDVNRLVIGLQDLVEYSLGPGIELVLDPETELAATFVDPVQLETAILNLVFNSRDALPLGGTIEIQTSTETQKGEKRLRVCVKDNGAGMSPDILARIYEPFFTTKEKGRGTGLGLSMVYGFVKQSGGEISIKSALGKGTQVAISFPLISMVGSTAEGASVTDKVSGEGEHILVVEDDPIMRATAADMIRKLGYQVTEAADADAARAALNHGRYDLVFTDMILPQGLTGLDIADYAQGAQPGIAVLFTTGYAREEAARRIKLRPESILVEKPYAMDVLAHALRATLKQKLA